MSELASPMGQDLVIIGASGDLARRKLLPALYKLAMQGLLPPEGRIIGGARRDIGDEGFRKLARESLEEFGEGEIDERIWQEFESRLFFRSVSEGFHPIGELTTQDQRLVYLAVPPEGLDANVQMLAAAGLVDGTRIVIEKPFGYDYQSARKLGDALNACFAESCIFRIDHYLGKEQVQNILVFRFGNSMFERMWHRDAIDHVEITVAESVGVEGRGEFYEQVGALRDIVQNHVLQMVSLLAMEPPAQMAPEAIRDEKDKVFRAMRPLDPVKTVRAQYVGGSIKGERVPGYREDVNLGDEAQTETYVSSCLEIDTWRWAGVPFFIRTGKRLRERLTEVTVVFREPPLMFFKGTEISHLRPDHLVLRVQPDEAIMLYFLAKRPGPEINAQTVSMEFSYRDSFPEQPPADAYERLLYDAMQGDQTLFARGDSVLRAWEVVQPVLDQPSPLRFYPAGSWGPDDADVLGNVHHWRLR